VGERRWSKTVRDEMVRLAKEGRRVDDLSVEFGPSASMIRLWLRFDRAGTAVSDVQGLDVTHPELVGQLDRDRNPDVEPARVTAGSQRRLWWRCPAGHVWQARVSSRAAGAGCPTCAGRHPAGIATTHPDLAAQLDPDRNPGVDPATLTAGSERKVWWRCPEGHSWQAQVVNRAGGTGCPACADRQRGLRAWETRQLGPGLRHTHPDLAAEAHPIRNPGVDLDRITAGSDRKLWWRCPAGHTWQAKVYSRTQGTGCPVCAGRHAAGIATTHPDLAAQLDPDRNPDVYPEKVTAGSHRKLWWRCPEGHLWRAAVVDRAQGTGCPTCGARANAARPRPSRPGASFAVTHPDVAAQLDPNRNRHVNLERIPAGSPRKLWWRCPQGHRWQGVARACRRPGSTKNPRPGYSTGGRVKAEGFPPPSVPASRAGGTAPGTGLGRLCRLPLFRLTPSPRRRQALVTARRGCGVRRRNRRSAARRVRVPSRPLTLELR